MSAPTDTPHPTIPTARLLLRPALPSDTEAIHKFRTHPETTHWTKSTTSDSVATTEEWIHRAFAPGKLSFLITLLESGEVVGAIRLTLVAENPIPRVGYEISPSYWNNGYATEALIGFLSEYWKLYPGGLKGSKRDEEGRVCEDAGVETSNVASLRVLEKVGFLPVAEVKVKDWYGGPDVVLKRLRILKPEAYTE